MKEGERNEAVSALHSFSMRCKNMCDIFSIQKMRRSSLILSLAPQVSFPSMYSILDFRIADRTNCAAYISNLVQTAIFNWLREKNSINF